jgi:hypothetical protein
LDHLINGAVSLGKELAGEAERDVVDDLGLGEGQERMIIAAPGKDAVGERSRGRGMGMMGGLGVLGSMRGISARLMDSRILLTIRTFILVVIFHGHLTRVANK